MADKLTLVVSISMVALLFFSRQSLGQVCNCSCKIHHERIKVCDELAKLHEKVVVIDWLIMREWIPAKEFVKDLQDNFGKKVMDVVENTLGEFRMRPLVDISERLLQLEKNAARVQSFIKDLQEELVEEKKARNKLEEHLVEEQTSRTKLEEMLKEEGKNRKELEEKLKEEQFERRALEEIVSEEKKFRRTLADGLAKEREDRQRSTIATRHRVETIKDNLTETRSTVISFGNEIVQFTDNAKQIVNMLPDDAQFVRSSLVTELDVFGQQINRNTDQLLRNAEHSN